jgi:protoporphyrinogen oxidase
VIRINTNTRIAIIGGGISGLVIAHRLQKKGYKNVAVFEKSNILGGKLHTIFYRNKSYEMGALFGMPCQKHLKTLMKEFNIKADGPKLSRVNYDIKGNEIMRIPKELLGDFVSELNRLPDVLVKYKSLEKINIHNIEEELMLPFSRWCEINRFNVLKTVYAHYITSYGLGHIEIIPALYVLRILNYDNLMSFMELPEFCTWKDGVFTLIECLSNKIDDVRLTQNVNSIHITENKTILVQTEFGLDEFDKVIITSSFNHFKSLFYNNKKMLFFMNNIKYQNYTVYAFITEKVPNKCGFVLENIPMIRKGHILIWNSRWGVLSDKELVMVYAYNNPKNSMETSLNIIKDDLTELGFHNSILYQYKNWHQCPYVDSSILREGFYDKIETIQGKNNVYFAGEIMSTITMDNCIRYSNYLVDSYF